VRFALVEILQRISGLANELDDGSIARCLAGYLDGALGHVFGFRPALLGFWPTLLANEGDEAYRAERIQADAA